MPQWPSLLWQFPTSHAFQFFFSELGHMFRSEFMPVFPLPPSLRPFHPDGVVSLTLESGIRGLPWFSLGLVAFLALVRCGWWSWCESC